MRRATHSSAPPRSDAADELVLAESHVGERLRRLVSERPLLTVAAAGAVGAVLGGLVLSRLSRLLFFAAAGYVANELWHREGRLDIDEVLERLMR
jgi:hypothetical protein